MFTPTVIGKAHFAHVGDFAVVFAHEDDEYHGNYTKEQVDGTDGNKGEVLLFGEQGIEEGGSPRPQPHEPGSETDFVADLFGLQVKVQFPALRDVTDHRDSTVKQVEKGE